MNKQWMALLLSAGMAVTTCPVPGAQEPPAEQIHTEQAEESSAAVHSDDSDREGLLRMSFSLKQNRPDQKQKLAHMKKKHRKMKIRKTTEPCWIYRPCVLIFRKLQKQRK